MSASAATTRSSRWCDGHVNFERKADDRVQVSVTPLAAAADAVAAE